MAQHRQTAIFPFSGGGSLEQWLCLAIALSFSAQHLHAGNPSAATWAQKGSAALAAGDYQTAVGLFQEAVASDPGEVSYLIDLANAFMQSGQYAEGQRALERGISILPDAAKQAQLWAALADLHMAWARDFKRSYTFEEAVRQYLAAFEIDKVHRPQSAGSELNYIGVIYKQAGAFEQAIQYYEKALDWHRRMQNRLAEGQTLDNLGQSYLSLSQFDKALAYLNEALPIRQEVKDLRGEGVTLTNIGNVYMAKGEHGKAIEFFEKALPVLHQAGASDGEVNALAGLGGAYSMLSRFDKAAEILENALPLARQGKNRQAEAAIQNNLGQTLENLGKYDEAMRAFNQALAIEREIKDRPGESASLSNLGSVYMNLGQFSEAIKVYEAALTISRDIKDRAGEASGLADVGVASSSLGDYEKASTYLEQALAIFHELGNAGAEASVLNNLSGAYDKLGQSGKKFAALERAVTLARQAGDLSGESVALDNLGSAYLSKGKYTQAISRHQQALTVARAIKDPRAEAGALASLMTDFRLSGKVSLAIFYGKLSVSAWERIRVGVRALGAESGKSYIQAQADIYRELADLLMSQGRVSEGSAILDLLKEQEYSKFIQRGGAAPAPPAPSVLTSQESDWEHRYQKSADQVAASAARRSQLRAQRSLTPQESQELKRLDFESEQAMGFFQRTLAELEREAQQTPSTEGKVQELRESEGLMQDVRDLGAGVVAICTLAGETKLHVILITPDVVIAREYPIGRLALEKKIAVFRNALQDPAEDPRTLAHDLYNILIGPIAKDLDGAHAQILMWSLDGMLRYLPIAALYDGEKYLLQRFCNVEFTLASRTRLAAVPVPGWKALGMGMSKAEPGFVALPSVPEELHDIVRDESGKPDLGVLPGKVLLNEEFTEDQVKNSLRISYPVVHIASHFELEPESEDRSFLLLGDGTHLTLTQLSLIPNLFANVDLLTLSACNTAVGSTNASGGEWESLGMIAQRKGAKAIIATLWSVADDSTTLLMQQFYHLHEMERGISKGEALRRAQLALLEGAGNPSRVRFAHPYFWAPFILIGNWK
ncbi:MAG: tetratricopeptide repeat protein [Verrucomicrobia bacterium]|nr:tetratricopeptide repeat protein [Verrucomicrobiota bacterium]